MKSLSINVSCATCKRAKPTILDNIYYNCKFVEKPFYFATHNPCENWMPSKSHLRTLIQNKPLL